MTSDQIKKLAEECGFELAGITPAAPLEDYERFDRWQASGFAAGMTYLTDRRGPLRSDPRNILPSAQTVVCVGKLYNTAVPNQSVSRSQNDEKLNGIISRYATGADYHEVLRASLHKLAQRISETCGEPVESRVCVDTAPLLERSLARQAGLGWIGKNTCLINQQQGSWFFLGELLLSLPLAPDTPPPDRCGSCRRCIDACPTDAIIPDLLADTYQIDSNRCISYLTIEHRGELPEGKAATTGNHLFGCDICQEVCPWNRRAPVTGDPAFQPRSDSLHLADLAAQSEPDFKAQFRTTPVWRTRYSGFLRNVATAMGNSGQAQFATPLASLAASDDPVVASTARAALLRLPLPPHSATSSEPGSVPT